MKFIVDAQLPIVLARFLVNRGHTAIHVADAGFRDADDSPIWFRALSQGEVVVTKDEDFAVRRMISKNGPQVVWLRIGNCSNRALLIWFDSVWGFVEARLAAGDALVEVV